MLGDDFVRALLARVHRALRSVEFLFRCRIGGWSIGAAGDEKSDDEKGSERDQFDFHSAFSMQAACHALNVDFKHLSYSVLRLKIGEPPLLFLFQNRDLSSRFWDSKRACSMSRF
jgi:hypothetical protein